MTEIATTDYEAVPAVAGQTDDAPVGTVVMKFGGTSVADSERLKAVAKRIVAARERGARVVAVLSAMGELGKKPQLRVVVLKGNGKHFQAGADLKWINAVRPQSPADNEAVSRATFEAVQRLNTLPIPTVALVQGGCFGGGTGVISACDVVIAADNALFSITEVRWGLTAAIIIPQLCDAIGVRQVRRYALTGERFGADDARRIGLVHEVVPLGELETAGAKVV